MATPSITYLPLDANGDIIVNTGQNLTGVYAVAQAIQTRLNLWYGEWWEDLTSGLPVFQQILGQLGSSVGLEAMQLAVRQVIEGTPYVTAIVSLTTTFEDGQLSFQVVVQTAFGPVTVSNLPGQQAVIGGA